MNNDEVAVDPVCGMTKRVSEFKFFSQYKGKMYYFCSQEDKNMFDAYPDRWVKKEEAIKP